MNTAYLLLGQLAQEHTTAKPQPVKPMNLLSWCFTMLSYGIRLIQKAAQHQQLQKKTEQTLALQPVFAKQEAFKQAQTLAKTAGPDTHRFQLEVQMLLEIVRPDGIEQELEALTWITQLACERAKERLNTLEALSLQYQSQQATDSTARLAFERSLEMAHTGQAHWTAIHQKLQVARQCLKSPAIKQLVERYWSLNSVLRLSIAEEDTIIQTLTHARECSGWSDAHQLKQLIHHIKQVCQLEKEVLSEMFHAAPLAS